MAGMPDINTMWISAKLPIELVVKVNRRAADLEVTRSALIETLLTNATRHIELTTAEAQRVVERIRVNENARTARNAKKQAMVTVRGKPEYFPGCGSYPTVHSRQRRAAR